MHKEDSILTISNLTMSFRDNPDVNVLNELSFTMRRGEILGLIGNSGCGKSMTALAISGLLPSTAQISSGEILLNGEDMLKKSPLELRHLRGKKISMIYQEPMSALDPLMTIGKNLDEVLVEHSEDDKATRYIRITKMLERVGFTDSREIYKRYPHQLSGGQRQRVLIAGAALLSPDLLIADEPTSALDSRTANSILDLLHSLCEELNISILFISHDLTIVSNFCDRVMVMNSGHIIEQGVANEILSNPHEQFTKDLLTKAELRPDHLNLEFASPEFDNPPVLEIKNLFAGYERKARFARHTQAVIHDISLKLYQGEIVGLVGGSGCGKTTLCKVITGLVPKISGNIFANKKIGMVFQDPGTSLNPSHTIRWHLTEPLRANKIKLNPDELEKLLVNTLESVDLKKEHLNRYPSELSGGQRQRVAIAMCLILDPSVIIADEPLSSLDASSGAKILKLLARINCTRKTSILMVSHNMKVIEAVATHVVVMEQGKIIKYGKPAECLDAYLNGSYNS